MSYWMESGFSVGGLGVLDLNGQVRQSPGQVCFLSGVILII